MGFDNIPIATIMEPQLSTVAQPMRELGETAARLLIDRLRNPLAKTGGILLKHELVLRQSA
jgi:DNA-binding LacI/PurR family transcriptional regulator